MKKRLFFVAVASLFTSMVSAADLYVRDFGIGGAYSTIGAAITAAVNGDRIIIRPKAGGIPYLENLTVDKSLTFVSETNFTKYLVQGTISITPFAGRVVTFNNLNVTSTVSVSAATTGGRTTLNILNSTTNTVNAPQSNTTLNMSGCIDTGGVYFTHGRCTGNKLSSFSILGTALDSNPSTDDIEMIGNAVSATGGICTINQKNYNFKLLNNYIIGSIMVSAVKTGSNNEIRNNVINNNSAPAQTAININLTTPNTAVISVINNIITCTGYNELSSNGVGSVYAFYNMSDSVFLMSSGITSASSNVSNASITTNNSIYTVTGANVNAGYPDDEYKDLDLSLNDIGNFGGSDSWSNYWPSAVGNKPQVNYLTTPRRIYIGTTTMNALGSGYSK